MAGESPSLGELMEMKRESVIALAEALCLFLFP